MAEVILGMGSNLGDKEKNIASAISFIKEKCTIKKTSKLYLTEPMGYLHQDKFLNGVLIIDTKFDPNELLTFLQVIEQKLKRVKTIKNGPRTIDLDILYYEDKIIDQVNLQIPHPRLYERAFVLEPLNEIADDFIDPVLEKKVSELLLKLKVPYDKA